MSAIGGLSSTESSSVAGRKIFVSHDSGLVTAHPEVNPKTGVRVGDNPTGTQRTDDPELGERISLLSSVDFFAREDG
jgi:hypothetical protein